MNAYNFHCKSKSIVKKYLYRICYFAANRSYNVRNDDNARNDELAIDCYIILELMAFRQELKTNETIYKIG